MCSNISIAQMSFDKIEFDAIPYPKIRAYIDRQHEFIHSENMSELEPTCTNITDFKDFRTYQKQYIVKADKDQVWATYINANPSTSWKTRKSAVGLIYDRPSDMVLYSKDSCYGSSIGQVLYLNLRLIKGIYNLATAMEITNIQDDSSMIEISYVESGVNQGKQWITMESTYDGYTRITHRSTIKSDSQFRDRVLYPYFHNKLINTFHRKMKRTVMQESAFMIRQYASD